MAAAAVAVLRVRGDACAAAGDLPAAGKTVTRLLTGEQLAGYGPWLDSQRRPRSLLAELETLSLAIAEADPRWNR